MLKVYRCPAAPCLCSACLLPLKIVGALHHGKTTLMDMLVEQTNDVRSLDIRTNGQQLRFTDTRVDEQARGISIKAMPMSLVLEGGTGKSFLVNLIDCPGHVNFNDEVGDLW